MDIYPQVMQDRASWTSEGDHARPVFDSIIRVARHLIPGTHVGICILDSDDHLTTLTGTDPLVFALDEMQSAADEGPSITAVREGHTVIIDDAESEHRWSGFISHAVNLGLRWYLGVPIGFDDRSLGCLNLYSRAHMHLDSDHLAHAQVFAAQASVALNQGRRENDLIAALRSSRTIGTAIGLTMQQHNLNSQEAFDHLAARSRMTNLNLREVAARLVQEANDVRQATATATATATAEPSDDDAPVAAWCPTLELAIDGDCHD